MYCKTCGQSIPDGSNYCLYDGTSFVDTSTSNGLKLANRSSNFCPKCGEKTNVTDNYCAGCGQSLLKFTKGEEEVKIQRKIPATRQESPKWTRAEESFFLSPASIVSVFKKSLVPVTIAFIAMFILSYVISSFINASYNEFFEETVGYSPTDIIEEFVFEFDTYVEAPGNIIGFTDVVMASHLMSPTYKIEGLVNLDNENSKMNGELAINGATILILLIPFISLFAAGILYRKKNHEVSMRSFLSGAIGIGLIYSILLTIISLFSGFHYELNFADSGESVSLTMDTAYPFFFTLIKGFVIGAAFSFLGMLFSINYRRITKQLGSLMPFGEAAHQGFATFLRGFSVMLVVTVIFIVTKINDIKERLEWEAVPFPDQLLEQSAVAVASMSVNFGAMMYSMLHFSPLTFEGSDGSFEGAGSIAYNIWTGFSTKGGANEIDMTVLEFMFSSNNIDLWLKLLIIIPTVLLIFAGYRMTKMGQTNFKSLAIFSVVYAIFVAILTGAVSVSFDGFMRVFGEESERMSMSLTINVLKAFVGSFILAYIAGFVGSFLRRFLPGKVM